MMDNLYYSKLDVIKDLESFTESKRLEFKVQIYNDLKDVWTEYLDGHTDLEDHAHLWNSIVEMHVNLYQPV